jgi:hypothetical protein
VDASDTIANSVMVNFMVVLDSGGSRNFLTSSDVWSIMRIPYVGNAYSGEDLGVTGTRCDH